MELEEDEFTEEEMTEFTADQYRRYFPGTKLDGLSDSELVNLIEGSNCFDCGAKPPEKFTNCFTLASHHIPVDEFIDPPYVRMMCTDCYQFYS